MYTNYIIEDAELQSGDFTDYEYEISYNAEQADYGVDRSPVEFGVEIIENTIIASKEALEHLRAPEIWEEHKELILDQCVEELLCY